MFMTLATSLVVLFNCYAIRSFYSNASCFSLLLLYLGNSQVSVYRTMGPTLVIIIIITIIIIIIIFIIIIIIIIINFTD